MKCNLCGQEYEFSLGHRCRVMQEESKQPQPDLVSKLREVIAKWPHVKYQTQVGQSTVCIPTECRRCQLESLLGLEGQAQEALCGTAGSAAISTNEAGRRTAMDVSPSEELLSRPHRIVSHEQMERVLNEPEPNVTVNPDGSCSPSTPIVPGTAGLSAEQVQRIVELHHNDGIFLWASMTADLNALLAAKPVGISIDALEDLMQQFKQREAKIRKSVLEEASRHQSIQFSIDLETHPYFCCSECDWKGDVWADHIRALAERPAPAGEVKGKKS